MTAAPEAGFADPVHDAQRCFRAILDAMSRPGRIARISGVTSPAPLGVAAGAALLTLLDHETPVWLDPDVWAARGWVAFHCGAAVVADPAACAFAVAMSLPDLTLFAEGTHEEPERSATVICQVDSFSKGQTFRLSGPGLREEEELSVQGLPRDFASIWERNHALFPRGIDLILCAGDQLTALPRTVSIQEV
ncbi:MAG: phosphonate C-P lyase system protein PhnH [Acetobacteraceae bacterium]|nr:phosphonate C-P lyase system protein PhnH [Acetobacteraceae bacterium]